MKISLYLNQNLLKNFTFLLITFFLQFNVYSQVYCISCFEQNEPVSTNITNLISNGGFENGCFSGQYFCPTSAFHSCDIQSWICTGGGESTYANVVDENATIIAEGNLAAYLGNYFCNPCSNNVNDLSCITYGDSCEVEGIPANFPNNPDDSYGGSTGVSISQTVNGLTIGNSYVLEFWSGGEGYDFFLEKGIFGIDVGFGNIMLSNVATNAFSTDLGIRYVVQFVANSTSHTIKFTNWGHICENCTEAIFDDVRLYILEEMNPIVNSCAPSNYGINLSSTNISCYTYNNGSANAYFNGAIEPVSYVWNPGGFANDSIFNLGPGTYFVTATDFNGNTLTDSVTIIEPEQLEVTCFVDFDSICVGTLLNLNSSVSGGTGSIHYQWSTNINDTLPLFQFSPLNSTQVNLTISDENNCISNDSLLVTVLPIVDITSTADTCICMGSSIDIIASGTPSYLWNTGQNTNIITVSPTVDSTYVVYYDNGICSDKDSTTICVRPIPIINAFGDTTIESNSIAYLFVTGEGTFDWGVNNTLNCQYCMEPEASPEETTLYTVSSTNDFGCTSTDQVQVIILDKELIFPNIITPNKDGKNDFFYIKNLKPNSKLKLYNRWGNVIFSTDSYLNNYSEKIVDGIYYYELITPSGESFFGFFHSN